MKTEMDFKELWHKQPVDEKPDTKKLLQRAKKLTSISRYKLIGVNLGLLATVAVWIKVLYGMHERATTSMIGTALMSLAVFTYLIAYNQLAPILFKTNLENNTQQYLSQLLSIKRKEEFLYKVMSNIYFILLTVGLALFLIQPVNKMSLFGATAFCVVTFGCMGLAWFYLRPLGEKRRRKYLHDTIEKLEKINHQLIQED